MSARARLARLFVGALVALAVAEIGTATAERATASSHEVLAWRPYEPHPLLGWAPAPGGAQVDRIDGRVVRDVPNSLGMLAPETSADKPAGTFRILFVGDSITEGLEVARDVRFVTRIDVALRARGGEALPAGRSGYQTDQEVLWYETEGRALDADVVVLVFFVGNDVMGNLDAVSPGPFGPVAKPRFRMTGGTLELVPPSVPSGAGRAAGGAVDALKALLSERSALYRSVRAAWGRVAGSIVFREVPSFWQVMRAQSPAAGEAWELTEVLLARLAAAVEGDGARFAVAIVPDEIQVDPAKWSAVLSRYALDPAEWDADAPSARLASICAERRLRCLDLLPALRGAQGDPYLPSGGHLSPLGHRIAADALLEWLSRERLIP